ncbi:hypothetical protein BROSI_A0093 [Candidatus Brocadia sinica JPN1]|uniref:Uncharacterized protein n=1 Tax=Candidatus Brocadia sinica JPN1 TaxID=1197129 RepID=A0ABQ0JS93_9BACT|nr:hypothetical protein BROSI_A0093 [Candidatus Brocadia sinica JPN1]
MTISSDIGMRKIPWKVILGWWFPKGYIVQRDEVQHAIDFLISRNWLTKHETTNFQKIYGINKKQLKKIKSFHASFKGKTDENKR